MTCKNECTVVFASNHDAFVGFREFLARHKKSNKITHSFMKPKPIVYLSDGTLVRFIGYNSSNLRGYRGVILSSDALEEMMKE